MKNWIHHREKCTGDRPEVHYKSQFVFCPEPHIAIALSEIMHDTVAYDIFAHDFYI